MLSVQNLSFAHGERVLFDDIQFSLDASERIALVGHNGAGKSTLLGVLSKKIPADDGAIHLFRNARLGVLVQEPELDLESTVVEVVESGLGLWNDALKSHQVACEKAALDPDDVELHTLIGDLTEKIDALGGFDIEHRVEEMLNRLSVAARDEKIASLSGGERRRVDLARLLLSAPDVLLLDEPTNHLDMEAIRFLGDVLKSHRGPVLFISHDRAFIDDVATRILELNLGKLYTHTPPYENFLHGQLNRQDVETRTLQKKKRMAARELAWLRTGPKARSTKQNARKDRAETLIDDFKDEVHLRRESQSKMRKSERRLAKTILDIQQLSLGMAGRVFFEDFDLMLVEGERWGIVGENGVGKSTLLKCLLKELEPLAGEVKWGGKSDVVFLDQHRKDLLPNTTLKEILTPDGGDYVYVGDEQIHICSYLENYMFDPSDRFRQVETLSGGERNRLLLARMLRNDGNVLLLDEPTNDLDITTLGILEDVLHNHKGVALVVSHDRTFLDRVCTGILAFEPTEDEGVECKIQVQQGDFTHYERMRAERERSAELESVASSSSKVEAKAASSSSKKKKENARKRSYNEEQEYAAIEAKVMVLEERKEEIDGILADGNIFVSDPDKGTALGQELSTLTTTIEGLYARWQELEELR
ncbi:MAG: ABC-F family ATP-binding cassette domain-containing protein [Deltaproteobacteria bacterium]|nr:ABC-F family ATP-binding cassette domain-containing protein [Deltaproteobacteria bacterium]